MFVGDESLCFGCACRWRVVSLTRGVDTCALKVRNEVSALRASDICAIAFTGALRRPMNSKHLLFPIHNPKIVNSMKSLEAYNNAGARGGSHLHLGLNVAAASH